MRQPRGNLLNSPGIFHLESKLHADQPRFSQTQCLIYEKWFRALSLMQGFEVHFWQFDTDGFSVIVEKGANKSAKRSEFVSGLADLGEVRLSDHVKRPKAVVLTATDEKRLHKYTSYFGQPNELAKQFKLRVSKHHNKLHENKGAIWADRIRIFRVPDNSADLIEVAAFILSNQLIAGNDDLSIWPSTYAGALSNDSNAIKGVKRIFQNDHSLQQNLETLKSLSISIVSKISNPPRRKSVRGPVPPWRPACESIESIQNKTTQFKSTYVEERVKARTRFLGMMDRFREFQQKTGLRGVPHGYREDIELRTWAASVRGLYHSNRLPEWKLKLIADSGLLEPAGAGISASWMRHYKELCSFHKEFGHARVKARDPLRKTLASWVWIQRGKRRKKQLLPEQIELLDAIDFNWQF